MSKGEKNLGKWEDIMEKQTEHFLGVKYLKVLQPVFLNDLKNLDKIQLENTSSLNASMLLGY